MKKITAFILALILFLSACNAAFASVAKNPLKLDAKAAVLVDTKSGKILYSYNARQKRSPASVTKVMSLILVAEAIESGKISLKDVTDINKDRLRDIVTIGRDLLAKKIGVEKKIGLERKRESKEGMFRSRNARMEKNI